eukprot:TRINITY_DN4542_c0_g1_i3.p2 TRINITY_DN4542_c0_g1~~TRINITY_DN4542_c0_g1_i3.p2  ORF type:complete len:120 (-),score=24.60 TRINITY_DN4542_c0_g1_i3:33-392(-)
MDSISIDLGHGSSRHSTRSSKHISQDSTGHKGVNNIHTREDSSRHKIIGSIQLILESSGKSKIFTSPRFGLGSSRHKVVDSIITKEDSRSAGKLVIIDNLPPRSRRNMIMKRNLDLIDF